MAVVQTPDTGQIERVEPAEEALTFTVVPALDGLGDVTVFPDGSFTRWRPCS
jgi:hypothetical protein